MALSVTGIALSDTKGCTVSDSWCCAVSDTGVALSVTGVAV